MRLTTRRMNNVDLSGVKNLHGLTVEEYRKILLKQNGACALSGIHFEYDYDKKKIVDPTTNKAPCIDHDHKMGHVRGILSSKLNLLADQWVNGNYGNLPEPIRLKEYRENYPAMVLNGRRMYK